MIESLGSIQRCMNKFYVTTPLYYVNGAPHIGHAYADVIADTLARAHRARGEETFFLTGTDEHGAKIARSAEEAKKDAKIFTDEQSKLFSDLATSLNLSNDDFIRTTDKEKHWPGVIAMWKALRDAGDIYKGTYNGLYCVGHEAFITEKDLVNGKCPDHEQEPEVIAEDNYFFRMSEYASQIRAFIVSDELKIVPKARKNEVLAMIDEGVEDISFSRPKKDVAWGIPVPDDSGHTMYVWCDALTNYISALGYGKEKEEALKMARFWPADVQVIGKDILRFHAIIWPTMLLAAGLPLPKMVFTHGLIMSGGKKMSKTLGNTVDPNEVMNTYGVDAFRNFLVAEIPAYDDGDFTVERFEEVYTSRLTNGIGNLVSRIATMIERFSEGELIRPGVEELQDAVLKQYISEVGTEKQIEVKGQDAELYIKTVIRPRYNEAIDAVKLNDAASIAWSVLKTCDGYIQDYEPFKMIKTEPEKAKAVLWNAAVLLLSGTQMLEPVMPGTAEKIYKIFNCDWTTDITEWKSIKAMRPEPLFPRLEKKS